MNKQYEFEKWDSDLAFMRSCIVEVLEDLELDSLVQYLPWGDSIQLPTAPINEKSVQVLSLCFSLLNMVEENTANQSRRKQSESKIGVWDQVIQEVKENKVSKEELSTLSSSLTIEPVLTAHPTEAKRATVLEHHRKIYMLLVKRENSMWSKAEQAEIKDTLLASIELLLRTGELYIDRPRVEDELRNITFYLTTVFPQALKMLHSRYMRAWNASGFQAEEIPRFPRILFGTWVGGDRDGHPFVNSEVTQTTLQTLRSLGLSLVRTHLSNLTRSLSLNDRLQKVPSELYERSENLKKEVDLDRVQTALERNPGEPWRQYVNLIGAKIPRVSHSLEAYEYREISELLQDLRLLDESLVSCNAGRIARKEVAPLISVIESMGFHLAKLDIRQNSAYYDKAIGQLFRAADNSLPTNYEELSLEERLPILEKELLNPRPLVRHDMPAGAEADEVRKTFSVVRDHYRSFGKDGLGSLVISMTRNLGDLLGVFLLCKETGLTCDESSTYPLPVVPLFETIDDLKRSTQVMDDFLEHPIQNQLTDEGRASQEVMIGYSDSSKDGGVLSSYWNLFKTQKEFIDLQKKKEIKFLFFHGRGGTISRGAGPTGRFLSALPHGCLTAGLKMTEQGETIAQKYGNLLTCSHNLELLQASTFRENLPIHDEPDSNDLYEILENAAAISQKAYQDLLREDGFVPFFRTATPVDIIELSKFGSRPPKRTGAATLDDLRAIPWVFSWNQSRFFMSGWYGVGKALQSIKESSTDTWTNLSTAVTSWAPAQYVFTNIESSIYSADVSIMKLYGSLCKEAELRERFMSMMEEEFVLTRKLLTELFKEEFKTRRPRLYKTLQLRDEPLRVLHQTQVNLLKNWRTERTPEIETQLLLTTNAIAGGLRTTG